MSSTKNGLRVKSYAQKTGYGPAGLRFPDSIRYQSHSAAKLLIYIASLNCFFFGQSSESLVYQGFQAVRTKLSTKLSTENLKIFKVPLNQALSAVLADFAGAASTVSNIS